MASVDPVGSHEVFVMAWNGNAGNQHMDTCLADREKSLRAVARGDRVHE